MGRACANQTLEIAFLDNLDIREMNRPLFKWTAGGCWWWWKFNSLPNIYTSIKESCYSGRMLSLREYLIFSIRYWAAFVSAGRFGSEMNLLIGLCLAFLVAECRGDYVKFFEKCTKEKNTFDCLKRRALDVLDRAAKDDTVYVVNDYVSIAKDPAVIPDSDTEQRSAGDNNATASLDDKLERKLHDYLASRSIKLTIPGGVIEGRGKKKEKGGYGGALLMGGMAMAGVMAQLAYAKIAFIAGTALLTAKIALVLSAIIGLKKLVSSSGGGHEVIYATASDPHGGYGGWSRSLGSS